MRRQPSVVISRSADISWDLFVVEWCHIVNRGYAGWLRHTKIARKHVLLNHQQCFSWGASTALYMGPDNVESMSFEVRKLLLDLWAKAAFLIIWYTKRLHYTLIRITSPTFDICIHTIFVKKHIVFQRCCIKDALRKFQIYNCRFIRKPFNLHAIFSWTGDIVVCRIFGRESLVAATQNGL